MRRSERENLEAQLATYLEIASVSVDEETLDYVKGRVAELEQRLRELESKAVNGARMPHYLAHIISRDGSQIGSVNIVDCADDQAAIEVAKLLVADHDVEVWQEGRKLIRLEHK